MNRGMKTLSTLILAKSRNEERTRRSNPVDIGSLILSQVRIRLSNSRQLNLYIFIGITRDECNIVDINPKSSSPSDSNSDSHRSKTKSLSSPILESGLINTSTNLRPNALITSKCNTGDNLEIPNARDSGIQLKLGSFYMSFVCLVF